MWTASGFIAAFHGLDSFPVPRMYLVFTLLESFRLSDVVWELKAFKVESLFLWAFVLVQVLVLVLELPQKPIEKDSLPRSI